MNKVKDEKVIRVLQMLDDRKDEYTKIHKQLLSMNLYLESAKYNNIIIGIDLSKKIIEEIL